MDGAALGAGGGEGGQVMSVPKGKLGSSLVLLPLLQLRSAPRVTQLPFCSVPTPCSQKWNPLMRCLAQPRISQACSFQKKLQTQPALATDSQENCKTEAFTPDQIPLSWVFELLVYIEDSQFLAFSREADGHRQLCHWGMAWEVWLQRESSICCKSSEDVADFSWKLAQAPLARDTESVDINESMKDPHSQLSHDRVGWQWQS